MTVFTVYVLRNLVPFAQFKKRQKQPWRSVNCSEVSHFTKCNTLSWVFFTFCKLYNCYHIVQCIMRKSRSDSDMSFALLNRRPCIRRNYSVVIILI